MGADRLVPFAAAGAVAWLVLRSQRDSESVSPPPVGGQPQDILGRAYESAPEGPAPLDFNYLTGACTFPDRAPGVEAFRDYVIQHFGGHDLGIERPCDQGAHSEHHEGRAWDWGTGEGADVRGFLEWLLDNGAEQARRAGVFYLIYDHHAIKPGHTEWGIYTGADPHTTHIHLSFSHAGAAGKTSFYGGSIA